MDKEENNKSSIHIKKKNFIISIVLVSFISIILLTSTLLSLTSDNNNGISPANAQTREPPPKSPSQLQAEEQQQQQSSSTDTITTQSRTGTCSSIPVQFTTSHSTYTITADSLKTALFNFKFADPTSGAPQAAETSSGEPQISGVQLDSKGRIICASAVIIPIQIEMPSWTNIGTLCTAIQNEWSSFLSKVSAHEQLHVNFIQTGFADYGNKIIGKTLQQAKEIYDRMATKVQKQHDSIDPPNIPLNLAIDDSQECKDCPSGQTFCDGKCVDTNTDIEHCGGCGNACGTAGVSSKLQCQSGVCTCGTETLGMYPRYQYCENVEGSGMFGCADKANDRYNCGTSGCNNVCGLACTGSGTCISA